MEEKHMNSQKEIVLMAETRRTRQSKSKSSLGQYPGNQVPIIPQQFQIENIYQEAQVFIRDVDQRISKLKQYNEDQTNKKYETIMKNLQIEVGVLKSRLDFEQNIKSPTKQYMHNLLNQLLTYKRHNEELEEELKSTRQVMRSQKEQIGRKAQGIHSLERAMKGRVERLPAIKYNGNEILELIAKFMQQKQTVNQLLKISNSESKLAKFLKDIHKQKPNWDVLKLLIEVDKWVQNDCHRAPQLDLWKIRYGMTERFNRLKGSVTPTPRQKVNKSQKSKRMKEVGITNFSSKRLQSSQKV